MNDLILEPLILDFLEWLENRERTYGEVMEAWRTSCPRLPVWEDANDRGLVTIHRARGLEIVLVTPSGEELLAKRRMSLI